MPHQIPTTVTDLNTLFGLLVEQFAEIQKDLGAAYGKATGARKVELSKLYDDKDIYHASLTKAKEFLTLGDTQAAAAPLALAVEAHNRIVDSLTTAPAKPAAVQTAVLPAVADAQVASPPAPPAKTATTPTPPVPPTPASPRTTDCAPTAAHVLNLIGQLSKIQYDKLVMDLGGANKSPVARLLTEKGKGGAHR